MDVVAKPDVRLPLSNSRKKTMTPAHPSGDIGTESTPSSAPSAALANGAERSGSINVPPARGGISAASNTVRSYSHPHEPAHVVFWYRYYILESKAKRRAQLLGQGKPVHMTKRGARGIIAYRAILDEYLAGKALLLSRGGSTSGVRELNREYLHARRKQQLQK